MYQEQNSYQILQTLQRIETLLNTISGNVTNIYSFIQNHLFGIITFGIIATLSVSMLVFISNLLKGR